MIIDISYLIFIDKIWCTFSSLFISHIGSTVYARYTSIHIYTRYSFFARIIPNKFKDSFWRVIKFRVQNYLNRNIEVQNEIRFPHSSLRVRSAPRLPAEKMGRREQELRKSPSSQTGVTTAIVLSSVSPVPLTILDCLDVSLLPGSSDSTCSRCCSPMISQRSVAVARFGAADRLSLSSGYGLQGIWGRWCLKFEAASSGSLYRKSDCFSFSKMRKARSLKNPIAFLCLVIFACCLFVVFVSVLRLPEAPARFSSLESYSATRPRKLSRSNIANLGMFGEMMVGMLPQDLAFTVFIPSQTAFERDLRLRSGDSFKEENVNNTFAIISRVLGFSAVPRHLSSAALPVGRELNYDSLSGFILHITKDEKGMITVNGVRSEQVDIEKGEIVLHVMDGVVMDADFEQSVQPDDDRWRQQFKSFC